MKPRLFSPLATSSLKKCFSPSGLPAVAFFAAIASSSLNAATLTWDGGAGGTGTDLGTAVNWTGDVLPSVVTPDTAEWNGTAAGPLALVYSNAVFAGGPGNGGLNLSIAAGQTAALNIDAGTNTGSLRMNGITIAAGAGAFSLGDGLNAFNLTLGGAAGTHTWVNNSSNTATIASEVVYGLGGGGNHILALGGSGNWALNNNLTNGGGNIAVTKTGAGTATLSGAANTYTGLTTVSGGKLNLTGTAPMVGALDVNGGGSLTLSGPFGTSNTNAVHHIGQASGKGTLNILPGVTITRLNMFVGDNIAGDGAVYQSGGTVTFTQAGLDTLRIGSSANGKGYYKISGGNLNVGELGIGASLANTVGVMEVTSGGTVANSGWTVLGRGTGTSSGVLNVNGGTMTALRTDINWAGTTGAQSIVNIANGSISNTGSATLGFNLASANVAGTLGEVNLLSGGTLTTGILTASNANPTTQVNFNGGTLRATTTNAGANFLASANVDAVYVHGGGGTVDNNGGTITLARPLLAPTGNGVNSAPSVTAGAGYIGAPMVAISGGGGTGAAAVAAVDPVTGTVTGITITNPGVDYTTTPTFTLSGGGSTTAATATGAAPTANTSGGMTFTGAGTTTVSGAGTYTGATLISSGTLTLAGAGSINSSSGININGSTAKLVQANFPAITPPVTLTQGSINGVGTISSLTVSNLTANTLDAGNGGSGALTATSLTFQGAATVNIIATGPTVDRNFQSDALTTNAAGQVVVNATNTNGVWLPGDYPIIYYNTSFTGSASHFQKGTIPNVSANQTATIVDAGYAIVLRIEGDSLTWTGNQSPNWTTTPVGGAFNWIYPSNSQNSEFTNSSAVLFDDSATGFSVNLASNVAPAVTVFDNSNNDYTLSSTGSFGITSGSIIKNGSAQVTITTTNTTTGSVTINGGILQLGNGATDGSLATSASITNNTGSLIFNLVGNHTYANPIAGGASGSFTKSGAGALTLSGANTFAGSFNLQAGTLNINSAGALGAAPGSLVITGGVINNSSGAAIVASGNKLQNWNADVTFTGSNDLTLGTGQVTLGGAGTSRSITVSAGTLGTGPIGSVGYDLVKTGAGALRLSGGNSVINGIVDLQSGIIGTGADFFANGLSGTGTFENGTAASKWSFWTITGNQTFTGIIQNGGGAGRLGIVKRGAGTWTLTNNANNANSNLTVDQGRLILNNTGTYGAALENGAAITNLTTVVGATAAANAVLEINGATVNYNNTSNPDLQPFRGTLAIANNATGAGAVSMTSGSLTAYRQLSIGNVGGSSGGYTQSNGTANVGGFLAIGLGTANGVFNLTGGTFTMTTAPVTNGAGAGSTGVMNLGGSSVFSQNGTADNGIWIGEAGAGFLNVSGTAALTFATTNNGLQLGRVAAGSGITNLLGGNVTTPRVYKGAGAGTLNFNGGSLTANAASTTFLTGLTNTYVHAGGGTVNNSGNAITIGQALLAPTGSGVSADGLTYSGAGFISTPIVQITGDGTGATAVATIDSGGNLTGIIITNPGTGYNTPPTFALLGGGIGNTGSIGGEASLAANVSGGMTFTGAGTTTLSGANTYTGNTSVGTGSTLALADNATLQFVPTTNGVSNKVTGLGSAVFSGDFNITLGGAAIANGNSWTLVDVSAKTFDPVTFTIPGFTQSSDVWTKVEGANTWTFTEASGLLTLQVAAGGTYAGWAAINANNEAANLDFDKDGTMNGVEYFMGATGSSFTSNPGIIGSTITWPKIAAFNGTYLVKTSTNLVTWTTAVTGIVDNGTSVVYMVPPNQAPLFVRLVVLPN